MRSNGRKEIKFTAHERRVLQIPQGEKQYGPEAIALRKIIDTLPWILTVADCRFDEGVRDASVVGSALHIQADDLVKKAVKEWAKKGKSEPVGTVKED